VNDLVVVAKTGKGKSHPTVDQGYLYSDWQFTVDQVIKDKSTALVKAGNAVIVTRPGGVLEIAGRKFYAQPKDFRDFVPGEELLLYLKFVKETGAYSLHQPTYFAVSEETLKAAREGAGLSTGDWCKQTPK
jgi:hypothetical protein